ncbi:hypothetical protein SAMN05421579_11437 [Xenorhabdus japonica]|uniref:Uncharacterized protein n=1 Tax=Xenorhabdus japonica TaxID=53341 RepID=A0A1I5AVT5_9GAMM|nr:hypothetical protein SAMN05421579_11437 [Xenorhabdus japonica]
MTIVPKSESTAVSEQIIYKMSKRFSSWSSVNNYTDEQTNREIKYFTDSKVVTVEKSIKLASISAKTTDNSY